MAKKIKHQAVLPDGSIAKRSSESREYSHMVAVRRNYDGDLAAAKASSHGPRDKRNFAYYVELASGAHDHVQPAPWRSKERCDEGIARAAALIAPYADAEAYAAAQQAERIARVEANKADGVFEKWGALGWSSRPDLAQKEFNRAMANSYYAEAKIIEAQIID